MNRRLLPLLVFLFAMPLAALAAPDLPGITASQTARGTQYSLNLQLLALMTTLTLLPSLLLMMTAFVRIVIVLALFLTLFVMSPVLGDVYQNALAPYMNQGMSFDRALAIAEKPLRAFMLNQTREDDIAMFMEIARNQAVSSPKDVPFMTLVPAFLTSELKSAFTIGFLIYIPFVVIDLIVSSVLMSMGMMMLSPMMISMPFKLMLFVLVDGWSLIMGSLASSFAMP